MSASAWVAVVLGVLLVAAIATLVEGGRRLREAREELARLREQATTVAVEERPRARQAAGVAVRTALDTVTRLREQGVRGMLLGSIEDLTAWALEDRHEIVRVADADGNVTLMFSDIEESTALNEELGDETWLRVLEAHDAVLTRCFHQHRGHVVKSAGDGYMVVFPTPELGIAAALAVQHALEQGRVPRALRRHPVRVRIGLHTGRAVERDGDWFGRNVALAARVASTARGGEVLVSTELAARLTEDLGHDLGQDLPWHLEQTEPVALKGLPGEHTLWQVHG